MLNITAPRLHNHWVYIVEMASNELQAKVPGMVRRDFRLTVPNSSAANPCAAADELAREMQRLTDNLNDGQPVRAFGAIIPAPEGAAAVLRLLAMPDAEGHFPEAIHRAVFATLQTTVTALDNHVNYTALSLIDLAAGTDLLEGAA